MSLRTPTILSRSGIVDLDALATAVDSGGSDWWVNTGAECVYVNNGSASSLTVTLNYAGPAATVDGATLNNKTVVIAAGKRALIGPFPQSLYNPNSGGSAGQATIAWSATASITMAVIRVQDATT